MEAVEQRRRAAQPLPDPARGVVGFVGNRQVLRPLEKGFREPDRDERYAARRIDDELRADRRLKLAAAHRDAPRGHAHESSNATVVFLVHQRGDQRVVRRVA
jgi:hypothetical protein